MLERTTSRRLCLASILLVLIVVAGGRGADAQNSNPRSLRLIVKSVSFDAASRTVDIELANLYRKSVIAYGLTTTLTHLDGQRTVTHITSDLLPSLAAEQAFGPAPGFTGAIRPSKTYHHVRSLPAQPERDIVGVSAHVTAIVFADDSAVGADSDVKIIFASRQRSAQEFREWVSEVKQIAASSEPLVLSLEASNKMGKREAEAQNDPSVITAPDSFQQHLQTYISLRQANDPRARQLLADSIKLYRVRLRLGTAHSQRKGGQAQ